jgi:hypothetical protein
MGTLQTLLPRHSFPRAGKLFISQLAHRFHVQRLTLALGRIDEKFRVAAFEEGAFFRLAETGFEHEHSQCVRVVGVEMVAVSAKDAVQRIDGSEARTGILDVRK